MYSGVFYDTADTADSVSCNGKIWSQQSAQIVRGAVEHTFKTLQDMENTCLLFDFKHSIRNIANYSRIITNFALKTCGV